MGEGNTPMGSEVKEFDSAQRMLLLVRSERPLVGRAVHYNTSHEYSSGERVSVLMLVFRCSVPWFTLTVV